MRCIAVLAPALLVVVVLLRTPVSGQAPGIKITPVLRTATTVTGQPIQYPRFPNQLTASLGEFEAGGADALHQHPVPNIVYVLEGTLTLEIEGQAPRVFTAGQAYVEPLNTWHRASNQGSTPARIISVVAGAKGKPGVVHAPGAALAKSKVTTVLQTETTVIGQPILLPASSSAIVALLGEFAPGAVNPRHLHPVHQFAYILEGALTLEPEGHQPYLFTAGQAFIEVLHTWHTASNRGATAVRFFTFFFSEEGKPLTINP